MDKTKVLCKRHVDPKGAGYGKYPHINIRCLDGKQVRINIRGK